ncbi:hypothetical protein LSM04_008283 [Trypanosoma melophagium]|uniref:uncharacterized protein n=1 Tax=Trypanosoma melophagium TaxID=715481 RepID=UPI003519F2DB|nr:hypothetical protein LSM04_008283 [Trypanosoma melophagium]
MSTQTEDNLDPDHKFPLLYAGHEIHVSTLGSTNKPKLLGIPLDPRLQLDLDLMTCVPFVIGYGSSKLLYGSELTWALSDDSPKNTFMRTQASLAKIVSGVPSRTDP